MQTTQPLDPALPEPVHRLLRERFERDDLELPFLPETAAQVLSMCNDETCDARRLADLMLRDQSLAGHVLRVANSAAFAPKEPIVSLQQAISRLGMSILCEIAVAASLRGRVFSVPGQKVKVRAMWMHSAAAGVYAKEIARRLRQNVEGAFMCGLLHDAGRPIVMQHLVELAKERTDRAVPDALLDAAMDAFHEEIGARMVRSWELPEWMAETIAHHHDYAAAGDARPYAAGVHLADLLSDWALAGETVADDFPAESTVIRDLNLYAEDVVDLLSRRERVLSVAEAFL